MLWFKLLLFLKKKDSFWRVFSNTFG